MSNAPNELRFGLCTDIHNDIAHDGRERLAAFIGRMNEEQVDFIVQMGDFCHPIPDNENFLAIWHRFKGPKYHVLGNHDMDSCDKRTVMDFIGMERNYYAFDHGDFHFVVLDANFIKHDGQFLDYEHGNYFRYRDEIPYVTDEQLEWLREDLMSTDKRTIIFSHQSLENQWDGILNRDQLHSILVSANKEAGYSKVMACLNGHNHLDAVTTIDGISYIEINSMSYQWLGSGYECIRYSEEVDNQYPTLKYTVPYKDPLYAIVTLKQGELSVEGVHSEFVGPSPLELGHCNMESGHEITPVISSRRLTFK